MAESDLIRGNVDTVILKVLYEGDRYGYDMIKQINAKSGGQWEIKQPTLYACLKRLEKQGFVASYWDASDSNGGRRKYYTLTDSGRDIFVSYKNEWERSRDLFGELITGDDPILPVDDFSDVEDDEYEVPKRRPRPSRPRPKAEKPQANVEYVPPAFEDAEYVHATADDAQEINEAQNEVYDEVKEQEPDEQNVHEQHEEFVQQSIFDTVDLNETVQTAEAEENSEEYVQEDEATEEYYSDAVSEENIEEQAQDARKNLPSEYYDEDEQEDLGDDIGTQPTVDPHTLIEEIYASTYTGNRSYSDARAATFNDDRESENETKVLPVPAKSAPPAPIPTTAAAPAPQKSTVQPYATDALPKAREEESAARREYRNILGDLVTSCENENNLMGVRAAAAEQAASATADGRIEVKRFDDVKQSVAELGNEVTIREHNDSAKQYNHKYYYYSNRLMMTHYTIMCAVMFALGLTLFLSFYFGMDVRMKYDYILYVFAGLFPIVMFIIAVIMFAGDPDRKKRINVNFRFSIIIRTVIMLQAAVIVYCFNLVWGMPVGFSVKYIPAIVIPCVYALFIPISELIFMTLLKSGHYAVE